MTGFGEAERDTDAGRVRVEIRTVNHRFFNAHIRTPGGFGRIEPTIEKWLRQHITRGHVKYTLSVNGSGSGDDRMVVELDVDRARRYRELLEGLQRELAIPGEVDLGMLARFSDLFRRVEVEDAPEVDEEVIRDATDEAVRGVVGMREAEGARLQDDLEERLFGMIRELDVVAERAPERLRAERDRLREAVRELTEKESVDQDRLAREVAYLAEKWDINEEVVRYRSHLDLFRETLAADSDEPVGKRLGFLVQEMHREANTIGSKANDARIAEAAVLLKEEIERLREQLENVE